VGSAKWCRGVVYFLDAVGTGKFGEHGSNAGGVVEVVVGEMLTNGLEGRPEFTAPIVARCDVDVGKEDDRELRVVELDAVGLQAAGLGAQ